MHHGHKELQYFMGSSYRRWALPAEVIEDVGRIHNALSSEFRSQSRATAAATVTS